MKRSTNRILTTHTGSLARPSEMMDFLEVQQQGKPVAVEAFDLAVKHAVNDSVKKQVESGVDVVNDGEMSKTSYAAYVNQRLSGFGGPDVARPKSLDAREFPEYSARAGGGGGPEPRSSCNAPLAWKDFSLVNKDIENLKAATKGLKTEEAFMTAISPGQLSNHHPNQYYPTREAYLEAVAETMRREYEAIAKAGIIVQLDCPDLVIRNNWYPDLSVQDFRKMVAESIEALNHATRNLSPEQVRFHVCWGAGEGPHNHDTELKDIVDLLLKARPAAFSIVSANGRHEHEWKLWKDVKLPAGKVIIPGVVDSTTNIVEHPETVAERLVRYAGMVGRENIMAGVDCGFGTGARRVPVVDAKIAWAKLRAQADGAAMASKELWKK